MERELRIIIGSLSVTMFLICCLLGQQHNYEKAIRNLEDLNDDLTYQISEKYNQIDELRHQIVALNESIETLSTTHGYKVIATNYYDGDGSSTSKTGSGLSIADFDVNEYGMYTYNGYLVCAVASWEGIKSKEKSLAKINELPSGYHVYHYGDKFKIWLNIDGGKVFDAIALDTCKMSMIKVENEDYQRVDIFVKEPFGKMMGFVFEED